MNHINPRHWRYARTRREADMNSNLHYVSTGKHLRYHEETDKWAYQWIAEVVLLIIGLGFIFGMMWL